MIALKRILPIVLLLALFLSGCRVQSPTQTDFFSMDTLMCVKLWDAPDESAADAVVQTVNRLAASLSVTDADSELSRLNQAGNAALSDETLALLRTALSLSSRTGGAFDPTVYPLVRLWGFTEQSQAVPDRASVQSALCAVGTDHVSIQGNHVTLSDGAMLDFGGIAKGYAAETCAQLLEAEGVPAALLSFGGNVQTVGTKPDGSAWSIGIADPQSPSQSVATLTFTGTLALVTSGGYQRYFEENGIRYHHILDPETGYPAQNELASVTILADSGTLADALSTALFVMGLERATEFWRASDDFEAVFLTKTGTICATEGAAPLLSDCEFEVIHR